ncbi:hypothetical protein ABFY58_25960 [Enterobacter soli]
MHSPNVPSVEWIEALLQKAAQRIPAERLWGKPGLRPENPRLARNPRRSGEHGEGGAEPASGLTPAHVLRHPIHQAANMNA